MLKVLKKVGFVLLLAAGYVLQAALFLWFWPVILQDMFSGQWERNKNYIKKIHRIQEQVKHEIYLRKQHEARSKRVWENRNSFFKQPEKPTRMSWAVWFRKENETRAKRVFENRNNFYKESKK